jgi:hypothetical protein
MNQSKLIVHLLVYLFNLSYFVFVYEGSGRLKIVCDDGTVNE